MSKNSKKRLFEDMLGSVRKQESKTESIVQTFLHAKTDAESIAEIQQENIAETIHESIAETIKETEAETCVAQEVQTQDVKESETIKETQEETIAETKQEEESKTKVHMKSKKDKDPASILFDRIGKKKVKVEDQRIRRTYWLTQTEIDMVDELAQLTGMDKYEVVSLAIQSMHARAKQKA